MSTINTTMKPSTPSSSLQSSSPGRISQIQTTPSSVLANQSPNVPAPECCCFSARFVNLILYLFNFIFLLSGICILLLTVLYGRPEVSKYLGETTKYLSNIIDLLGNGHLVQIIHYSMLSCGIIIIIISLINICFSTATSWSKSSDYYYYHRKNRHHNQQQSNENESLLYGSSCQHDHHHAKNGSIVDSTIDHQHLQSSSIFDDSFMNQSRITDESKQHDSTPSSSSLVSNTSSSANNTNIKNHPRHQSIQIYNDDNGTRTDLRHQLETRQQLERHNSSISHFANSTIVLCCYIFILLFLFTVQLVIGLLSIITVSPEHVFVSTHSINDDDFLVSVRESVDIPNLLVNRGEDIEKLYGIFHCCGWVYFDDYEYLTDPNVRNKTVAVPDACCKTYVKNCGRRKHPNNIYYDGCWSKFGTEMRDYVLMLGWTALGFAVIELIGLMFAVCHYIQIVSKI